MPQAAAVRQASDKPSRFLTAPRSHPWTGRGGIGHDDRVTGGDFLGDAVAELYSSDPQTFTEQRGVLAARARTAGEALAAKRIAGLRKPTRSAWIVNQLIRSDPGVPARLSALGEEFRAAQQARDGARIRELALARHRLIEDLAVQAFAVTGQQSPAAALREEVTATLAAALADPQAAEQIGAGTLVRAARQGGLGSALPPVLTDVPAPTGRSRATAAKPGRGATAAARDRAEQERRAQAEQERHRQNLRDAQRAAAEADRAAGAAIAAEQEQQHAVELIEERLTEARRRLHAARLEARRAVTRQRAARRAVDRLESQPPGRASTSTGSDGFKYR